MEDKKENLSLLQQNSFLETPVDIFSEESSKEPEILKELEFLTGSEEIMFGDGLPGDGLPAKLPCIRLVRKKFELTNQDSVGGKNSSVLSDVKELKSGNTFLTGCGIKYP